MANGDDFNRAAESARLLTKLSIFARIGALILLVTTLAVSGSRGSMTLQIAAIPYVFALLFSAASLVYGILRTSVAHEDEEKKLLEKRMESRYNAIIGPAALATIVVNPAARPTPIVKYMEVGTLSELQYFRRT